MPTGAINSSLTFDLTQRDTRESRNPLENRLIRNTEEMASDANQYVKWLFEILLIFMSSKYLVFALDFRLWKAKLTSLQASHEDEQSQQTFTFMKKIFQKCSHIFSYGEW